MWQVTREVLSVDGERMAHEVQAANITEREAVEIAAECNRLEMESPSYDDGAQVVYVLDLIES